MLSQVPAAESGAGPTDWASYCRQRRLPLASPAPLLLAAPLTIYWAATRLLGAAAVIHQATGQGEPQAGQQARQTLVVHCLGPQRELDQWPALLELGCLLPHLDIRLHLVGPDVPPWAHTRSVTVGSPSAARTCGRHGCSCSSGDGGADGAEGQQRQGQQVRDEQAVGSVCLHFHRGCYHELAGELGAQRGAPHLVVGLNAGLAAYLSWVPTLQRLAAGMTDMPAEGSKGPSTSGSCGARGSARGSDGQQRQAHGGAAAGSGDGGVIGANSSADCRAQRRLAALETGSDHGAAPSLCLFTDYNEEACFRAQQMVKGVLNPAQLRRLRVSSGGDINPFHAPLLALPPDNRLPTASSGFALWIEAAAGVAGELCGAAPSPTASQHGEALLAAVFCQQDVLTPDLAKALEAAAGCGEAGTVQALAERKREVELILEKAQLRATVGGRPMTAEVAEQDVALAAAATAAQQERLRPLLGPSGGLASATVAGRLASRARDTARPTARIQILQALLATNRTVLGSLLASSVQPVLMAALGHWLQQAESGDSQHTLLRLLLQVMAAMPLSVQQVRSLASWQAAAERLGGSKNAGVAAAARQLSQHWQELLVAPPSELEQQQQQQQQASCAPALALAVAAAGAAGKVAPPMPPSLLGKRPAEAEGQAAVKVRVAQAAVRVKMKAEAAPAAPSYAGSEEQQAFDVPAPAPSASAANTAFPTAAEQQQEPALLAVAAGAVAAPVPAPAAYAPPRPTKSSHKRKPAVQAVGPRSGPKGRTSPFVGVTQNRRTLRWEGHIWISNPRAKGYQKHLGSFPTAEEAARCYDRAALKLRGRGAELNFPLSDYENDAFLAEHAHTDSARFLELLREHYSSALLRPPPKRGDSAPPSPKRAATATHAPEAALAYQVPPLAYQASQQQQQQMSLEQRYPEIAAYHAHKERLEALRRQRREEEAVAGAAAHERLAGLRATVEPWRPPPANAAAAAVEDYAAGEESTEAHRLAQARAGGGAPAATHAWAADVPAEPPHEEGGPPPPLGPAAGFFFDAPSARAPGVPVASGPPPAMPFTPVDPGGEQLLEQRQQNALMLQAGVRLPHLVYGL
eukprot:scaffold14.g1168.t1